jgi:adenosylcobinamide-phosphate synthase
MRTRALGLLIGYAADRVLGDPRRLHPVAGFGTAATRLEQGVYADSRPRGAAYTAILVGGAVTLGVLGERASRDRSLAHLLLVATCTWAVLGSRSLEREAEAVHAHLVDGDLPGARQRLTHLVGRDTSSLDESEIARAVVESVAENTADAVVAPLLWGAVLGVPGLLGYRAANTLDAMVGHHSERYERFGWASARLDDLLNLPASRLTGLLGLVAARGRAGEAWRTWRRDASRHPSPNAGVPESVFAGALGIRLGGTNRYGDHVEDRPVLGDGRAATADDIAAALQLAKRVDDGAATVAALLLSRWGFGHGQ